MAQAIVTPDLLQEFADKLRREIYRLDEIKSSMEQFFNGFDFHNAVIHRFKIDYDERMKLIEEKLLPAMEEYLKSLQVYHHFLSEIEK